MTGWAQEKGRVGADEKKTEWVVWLRTQLWMNDSEEPAGWVRGGGLAPGKRA